MIVEETFFRPDEVAREARSMPAETYNLAHTLLQHAGGACLFVPIRSMQFLAVLDATEFVFVDREGGRNIEIAWQRMHPQARAALADPVPYEAVYYRAEGRGQMLRLQGEFLKALRILAEREPPAAQSARIIKLPRPHDP